MTGTAPRVALVDGDVTIDWNIAHTRRHAERGASWNPDDATRIYSQAGGAALLAQLIGAIARQLEDADGPHWRVEFAAGPPSAPTPGDGTLHHSYSVWTNHGGTREAPVWRVEEFLGLDPKIRQDAPATREGQARNVELVVLD